jgi:hypothetical protein
MPASHVASVPSSRLHALKHRHADLSRQVEELQRSVSVNEWTLRELKLQKLTLKEQIIMLEEQRTAGSA